MVAVVLTNVSRHSSRAATNFRELDCRRVIDLPILHRPLPRQRDKRWHPHPARSTGTTECLDVRTGIVWSLVLLTCITRKDMFCFLLGRSPVSVAFLQQATQIASISSFGLK
jgi:hypothetical protein